MTDMIAPSFAKRSLAFALFSSLALLYNPFFDPPTIVKFAITFAIFLAGTIAALILLPRHSKWRISTPLTLFAFMMLLAALRMNEVLGADDDTGTQTDIIQILLMVTIAIATTICCSVCGLRAFLEGLTAWCFIIAVYLAANFSFILDPQPWKQLGEFDADSYQQVSLILGITCIALAYTFARNPVSLFGIAAGVLAVLFFVLVLNNRARGEFVALCVALAVRFAPRAALLIITLIFVNLSWVGSLAQASDLPVFERMARLFEDGGFGLRGDFYERAGLVLWERLDVTSVGGGGNFFQSYYSLPKGEHPHNFVIEGWITGGLALAGLLIYLFVWPVVRAYWRLLLGKKVPHEALAICIFVLLIHLKSGSLNSAWMLAVTIPVFSSLRQFGLARAIELHPHISPTRPA